MARRVQRVTAAIIAASAVGGATFGAYKLSGYGDEATGDTSRQGPASPTHLSAPQDSAAARYQARHHATVHAGDTVLRRAPGSTVAPWFNGRVESASLASNSPMEDRHKACLLPSSGRLLVGMFDGHAGWRCSEALAHHLSAYVDRRLGHGGSADSAGAGPTGANGSSVSVPQALEAAFLEMDHDLVHTVVERSLDSHRQGLVNKYANTALAGACAVAVVVGDTDYHTVNTGDCRAVLGATKGPGRYGALPLSRDQTAETPEEVVRIWREHPGEERTSVFRGRVLGSLQPARTFGDASFKWPVRFGRAIGVDMPQFSFTPPYVTARPEVTVVSRHKTDRFIILATDGLWDVVSSMEAVQAAGEHLYSHGGNEETTASHLLTLALQRYADESTGGSVNRLLDIPSPKSRNHRDDISVSVVVLHDDGAPPPSPSHLPVCDAIDWQAAFAADASQPAPQ